MTKITEQASNPVNEDTLKQLWNQHNWKEIERQVKRIQERIYCATTKKEWYNVSKLQKLLAKSYFNKLLAIKRVTQENRGKSTPGVDNETFLIDSKRQKLSYEEFNYLSFRPRPVKRVYIPKSKDASRPLGIPTIRDRIMQEIVRTALEPEWEARFEPNVFGFRPGYSTMDAVISIWNNLNKKTGSCWVFDADISACFDNISHEVITDRIPTFKIIIRRWLKAGVIEFGKRSQTPKGVPQGGIVSPLLANIALDGMERLFGMESRNGKYIPPCKRRRNNKGINLIRYADDFVITAPSKEILENYVIPRVSEFLSTRGLELNRIKSRIVHRITGFDFLGFTFKYVSKGFKKRVLLVKPSKKSIKHLNLEIKKVIRNSGHLTAEEIIKHLNSKLRGWCNYFRFSNAKDTFNKINSDLFYKVWRWTKRKHPKKNATWRKNKYFISTESKSWVFSSEGVNLYNPAHLSIKNFIKVKRFASVYNPHLKKYWEDRKDGNRYYSTNYSF